MELLKNRIKKDGKTRGDSIVKVDSFLNHQLDPNLLNEIGKEFYERFKDEGISKVVTIEASGIAIASLTALHFNVPAVFAKKVESKNLDAETYEADVYSFTKGRDYKIRISKKYIGKDDKILIVDDFMAMGKASLGLMDIVSQAGAELKGIGIVIEKGFQEGGQVIRKKGVKVESLAIIDSIDENNIIFRGEN